MPDTNTVQNAKNQRPAENAHIAQNSEELKGKQTKKLSMEELIPVEEIQVDPCGNGLKQKEMEKNLRQQSHHTACIYISRVSNIESDDSQNVGLEDYNNISVGIFPYFTTPSIKITLG